MAEQGKEKQDTKAIRGKRRRPAAYIFSLAVLISFACGCSLVRIYDEPFVAADYSSYVPEKIEWKEVNGCCGYYLFEDSAIPLRWHCVKVDLSYPGLQITAFPSAEEDIGKGSTAKRFARKSGSFVSINTSPFAGKFLARRTIVGAHKAGGKVFAAAEPRYSALLFKREDDGTLRGFIEQNQDDAEIEKYDYAFGGFFTILKNGEKTYFTFESRNSRTAAGLSADGKTLFLLVVEGERPFKSKGLSYPECADIMASLGAADCLEMDGGGSSSLFINGKNMLYYRTIRHDAAFLGFKKE